MPSRTPVSTLDAPQAIGPYSQAIVANGLVFVSGQIALAPGSPNLVSADVTEQTRQAMANVSAILVAAGSALERIVQATIYVTDIDDFRAVNGEYAKYFSDAPPARATIAVVALPLGAKVEIAVTALTSPSTESQ